MTDNTSTELLLLVGRIDGKLDAVITQHADHGRRLDAHEGRLTALEHKGIRAATTIGLIASGLAVASQYLLEIFFKG